MTRQSFDLDAEWDESMKAAGHLRTREPFWRLE